MATEKQRAAARRNIKKAQVAAAAKRAIVRRTQEPTSARSFARDDVAARDDMKETPRTDPATVGELIARLTREREDAATQPSMSNTHASPAKQSLENQRTEPETAPSLRERAAAARVALRKAPLTGLGLLVGLALISSFLFGIIIARGPSVPAGVELVPTASPNVRAISVTTPNPTRPTPRAATPGSIATATASPLSAAPPAISQRIPLRTETLVAHGWRDIAGTVRVHVVVSATNDTNDVRTLATAERTFRLIGSDGQTLHSGRFAYAFPFVVAPGDTSHLITTVVLPAGTDTADLRVESEMVGTATVAAQPMLEVVDLRLSSTGGRPGVRGIVRNTGVDDVTFGVVAVIARDAAGRVLGGFYDNVNVASIAAGSETAFQTEYPGISPEVAAGIADLTGVAFDVGTSLP